MISTRLISARVTPVATWRSKLALIACASLTAAALAACNPSESADPTPSPTSPSTSPTSSPTPSYKGELVEASIGAQPTICGEQVGIGGARPGAVRLGWEYPNNEWYEVGDTFEPSPGCVVTVVSVTEGSDEANPGTVVFAVNE